MNIYILSSDKSIHAVESMQYFINKYWKPNPQVKVLSYNQPKNFTLEDNFELLSMGEDEGYEYVVSKIYNFMSDIKDDYFIFTVDDFLPIRPIDTDLIEYLELLMIENNIPRISLNNDFYNKNHHEVVDIGDNKILQLDDSVTYPGKISAIWSIWSKQFFLDSMQNAVSLWDWERSGNKNQKSILGVKNGVVDSCHLFKAATLRNAWSVIVDGKGRIDIEDETIINNFLKKWKSEKVIQL
jgi:hypothetical protein